MKYGVAFIQKRLPPFELDQVGADMRQANSNHHRQEILLHIVTNTVENEFGRYFNQRNVYTTSHWLPKLAGQQMHMLESTNTAENVTNTYKIYWPVRQM